MSADPDRMRSIPCAIEAPEFFRPRARYALEMLLEPLEVVPRWVNPAHLSGETPGIYYGTSPETAGNRVVAVELHRSTIEYFAGRKPYPSDQVSWQEIDGTEIPVLFPLGEDGMDIAASAFFWLAGWQEYTTRARDRHGRFPYESSLQARWDLTGLPSVDYYRRWLKYRLMSVEVSVEEQRWHDAPWAVALTHDIDYLRKWRPGIVYREGVEYFLQNKINRPMDERWNRLIHAGRSATGKQDPYRYSWEEMQRQERLRGVTATYFVKTGAHSPYDVDGSSSRKYLKKRVVDLLSDGFEIGLHPSYHAATHVGYIEQEFESLQCMTGCEVRTVRQHYLRYRDPLTPRLQSGLGLEIDSSVAFAERIGFRRGTCLPYRTFDILRNEPFDMWSVPLAVMDSTFFGYGNASPEEAISKTRQLLDTCRDLGGVCVLLWHNIIYDPVDGHGFNRHFETILDEVSASSAFVGSIGDVVDAWE